MIENFNTINLMKETCGKHFRVPVIVTYINSAHSFYVQLASDEVQRYFEYFSKSLHFDCVNPDSEILRFNAKNTAPKWRKGHFAFFSAFTSKGVRWLRGSIVGSDTLAENVCIQDLDSGIPYRVSSKELLRCPPLSPYSSTGRFAVECKLAMDELKSEIDLSAKPITERFKKLINLHGDCLRLRAYRPDPTVFPVQMFVRQIEWKPNLGLSASFQTVEILRLLFQDDQVKAQSNETLIDNVSSHRWLKAKSLYESKMKLQWHILNSFDLNRRTRTKNQCNFYLPARLPKHFNFRGRVTYVSDSLNVSVQVVWDDQSEEPIHRINEEICFAMFRKGRFERDEVYTSGMCVTVYDRKSSSWNRAEILEVKNETAIRVQFVDYGRHVWLHPQLVSSEVFATHEPKQALMFKLFGANFHMTDNMKDISQKVRELLVDKEFDMQICRYDPLELKIITPSLELLFPDLFCEKIIVSRTNNFVSMAYHNDIIKRLINSAYIHDCVDFSKSDTYSIQLSSFSHKNYFWFQVNTFHFECNSEQQNINLNLVSYVKSKAKFVKSKQPFPAGQPSDSTLCLALYQKYWYRAMVLNRYQDCDRYRVLFVDYGNTEDCELNE